MEVRVLRLKDEGEEEGEVEGDTLEHMLDRLLGSSSGEEPGSEWKRDSFLLVWGLSSKVQKP